MCAIESMANSTDKHPKIKFVLQWIHRKKVDLLEREHTYNRPGWRSKSQCDLINDMHVVCRGLFYGIQFKNCTIYSVTITLITSIC